MGLRWNYNGKGWHGMAFFHDMETERLLLRNISAADREFVFRQFSDDDVNRYLFDAEPLREMEEADEIIGFYTQPEPRAQHRWVLVRKEDGERIGTCGFHRWDGERADVGYDLRKAHWGKGYMSEAMRAILPFAQNEMKVKRIDAHIYRENVDSIKLARRHGFVWGGETITYTFRGTEYPHDVYTLDKGRMSYGRNNPGDSVAAVWVPRR